jgi:hypothetical protein
MSKLTSKQWAAKVKRLERMTEQARRLSIQIESNANNWGPPVAVQFQALAVAVDAMAQALSTAAFQLDWEVTSAMDKAAKAPQKAAKK